MIDHLQLRSILDRDSRYKLNAYYYVLETLDFARSELGMGHLTERNPHTADEENDEPENLARHITGEELCEALKIRATWMFGYMAKTVFQQWGITTTDDFGEIVYNMIEAGKMRAADGESRADFHDLYDFQTVFCDAFCFTTTQNVPQYVY
ncbi:MAG: hypothetical protein Q4D98_06350 [Planctomycetia bacterium]|nr:hypothetical protein [Planctomycetia bacterium]